jgi:hypothetical protein
VSTIQDLVNGARAGGLEDPDKAHWTDEELLQYAKDMVADLKVMRPDMFFGQWSFDPSSISLVSTFPFDQDFTGKCQEYIIARANMADSEFVTSGRASLAQQLFSAGML